MGPPGSSPRTLGEHVGWVAGSGPPDSGTPHMVSPAVEQPGTRVSRAGCLASFPDPGRRGAVQTGMGWVPDAQGRSALAVSVRSRLSALAVWGRSFDLAAGIVRQRAPRPSVRLLPRGAVQALAARGIVQHLLRRVVRQCSPRSRPCSVLAVEPVQGPLNAPDWLAGQHADRAWPTRRRGIRMPWWCWPVGRSPCCSPRQWPPGNESPCLIPRQR